MNLPNRLTLFRVLLVPFFVYFLLEEYKIIALTIFIVASLTDFFDGYLARKNNQITNFGKFMDPLADKLLVCSALICLSYMNKINIYITLLIIAREFIISGIRLIAAEKGFVIAASYWGKIKTVTQMIGIILTIIVLNYDLFPKVDIANSVPHFSYIIIDIGATIFIYISLILTIISLIDYIYKNRELFKNQI